MKLLLSLHDTALAYRVQWKLDEAGIVCAVTSDTNTLGSARCHVWIYDAAQELTAREIASTVIPLAAMHDPTCPECGYDLRGHTDRTKCPECGTEVLASMPATRECAKCGQSYAASLLNSICTHCGHDPVTPLPDRTCPQCNEDVPGSFEVCWNCGADVTRFAASNAMSAAIRLATRDDLPAILAISNHYAATTPANFAIEPESLEHWQRDFDATHAKYPWFVATDDVGTVIGFAKASPWKGRCAYAHSAETTVYLAPGTFRRGIGRLLYTRLIRTMEAQGFRTLIGGITLPNPASVGLHEALGYTKVAHFPRVGWKFGSWHDVGYWELQLGDPNAPPEAIKPVADVIESLQTTR